MTKVAVFCPLCGERVAVLVKPTDVKFVHSYLDVTFDKSRVSHICRMDEAVANPDPIKE